MDPYQQPSGSSPQSNPYDFITNPGQPSKKPLFPFGGGNSMMKRLFLVLGGAVVFMIVAMIVVALLTSGSNGGTDSLKKLVAQQEELVRLADFGAKSGQGQETRALASTAQLSIATQQQELNSVLEERNIKLTKEELAAERDSQIDKLFETAITNNRFDDTFKTEFIQKLTSYLGLLKSTYESSDNETIKNLLSDMYTSAATLLSPSAE